MIYDEETGRFYLNEFHMQNSKGALELWKKQKPFSREEMIAQLHKFQRSKPTMKVRSTHSKTKSS